MCDLDDGDEGILKQEEYEPNTHCEWWMNVSISKECIKSICDTAVQSNTKTNQHWPNFFRKCLKKLNIQHQFA